MSNRLLGGIGLVIALVALVAINMYSNLSFTGARLDLTESGAYTLTDGTLKTIDAIDEPITLRLFLSEEIAKQSPGVNTFALRVKDMLLEYQRRSGGRIRLEIIDPEPFSVEEDRAVGFGLHAIPVGGEGTNFYFGLVGSNSTDDEVIVPYMNLDREPFLEYDLTKLVWQLLDTRTPVLGIMSSLQVSGAPPQQAMMGRPPEPAWMVVDQIRETFDVREIPLSVARIPDEIDVLMVIHPKSLTSRTLYAIDQFVMRGGRLALYMDPNAEADQPSPMAGPMGFSRSSDLGPLLDAWGIEFDNNTFIGDLQFALTVRFQTRGRLVTTEYPAWFDLPQEQLAENEITTANLGKLVFGSPGAVALKEGSTLEMTPLVRTSAEAMRMPLKELDPQAEPGAMLRTYKSDGEPYVLAARFVGRVPSAFPEGPPAAAKGKADTAPTPGGEHLASSTEAVSLVVVADTDMLTDRFWVQVQDMLGSRIAVPSAGNGSFVTNLLDNLSGSSDLISVRSRGSYARPFLRVNEIRREAELQFRAKEQELTEALNATERKLVELESAKPGSSGEALVLSEEQEAEIERFRQQKVSIRKELRTVLHDRQKSIKELEFNLRLFNIALMPVLVIIAGVLVALWQTQRRRVIARAHQV